MPVCSGVETEKARADCSARALVWIVQGIS